MALDSAIIIDGDTGWTGFRSRPDPLTLPAGVAAMAQNMRFVRGRAEVRHGIKRMARDISIVGAPLTLPFTLGSDMAAVSMIRSGTVVTVVTASDHGYFPDQIVNIRGADQDEYNGDWVIDVTGTNRITFLIETFPDENATGTILVVGEPILRSSYDGGVFAACVFSSPGNDETENGKEWLVLAAADRAYLWRDQKLTLSRAYPVGELISPEDDVQILQAFDQLLLLRSRPIGGDYGRRTASELAHTAGTATMTFAADHGFTDGERISVEGAVEAAYNQEFDIASVPTTKTLTFTVGHSPTSPATGTVTARRVRKPLVWDGGAGDFVATGGGSSELGATYSTLRSASVAAYFNNQLVICPTPTKDTVLVSDVLDYNTFDPLQKSFRANAGSADSIVALHAFAEGNILVFMRNSIYRSYIEINAEGSAINPATSYIELLTSEVGCRARRTVVTAGPNIFFLADQGVYRVDIGNTDYKVRGTQIPLSDQVSDIIDRLNEDFVHTSTAMWHDNRYWLAVPIDGSELPNCLLVWNALNGEWESMDTMPSGLHTLMVSDYQGKRRLFAASRTGVLFLLGELATGDELDSASSLTVYPIQAVLTTRQYDFKDPGPKRFQRVLARVTLDEDSAISMKAQLFDRDNEYDLGTETNAGLLEDMSLKRVIRAKAHGAQIEFSNTVQGRWQLRGVAVEAVSLAPNLTSRSES